MKKSQMESEITLIIPKKKNALQLNQELEKNCWLITLTPEVYFSFILYEEWVGVGF